MTISARKVEREQKVPVVCRVRIEDLQGYKDLSMRDLLQSAS